MEEKMMKAWGFREMNSSELQLRGGASGNFFTGVVEKVRDVINFIADYLPNLLAGIKDGFLGKSIAL